MNKQDQNYQWAVVGAGPAGIAAIGALLDANIAPQHILWIDPEFKGGDFAKYWGEVSSNTQIHLFSKFLNGFYAFDYINCPQDFRMDETHPNHYVQLKAVAKPLQWITQQLRDKVCSVKAYVSEQKIIDGYWQLHTTAGIFASQKVILATGAKTKSLNQPEVPLLPLADALNPQKLTTIVDTNQRVAVFGSSHSAMICIKNLLEAGVKEVINFYLSPIKYALVMDGWTLYDNTGLKGATAEWTRENISQRLHPQIRRCISSAENIKKLLPQCDQAVHAVGFSQRLPHLENIDATHYDRNYGIIAPGLFGCGIGFPREVTDPNGNKELNVGLYKFMNDLNDWLPTWMRYHI